MLHSESTFIGAKQTSIRLQTWLPEAPPRGVIVVAHGYGEHGGRYGNVVDALGPKGYALYIADHRGHGKSAGTRALIDSFEYLLDDLDQVFATARKEQPGLPMFLLGHSMGGSIALASALRRGDHLHGLVLSGPAVLFDGVSRPTKWLAAVLGRLAPKLGTRKLSAAGVSRDPDVVRAYEGDPLVFHDKMPAGTAAALFKRAARFADDLPSLRVPLLVVHGSADTLVPVSAGRFAYGRAGSSDKTLKVYSGLAHEVFNEPERAEVLHEVALWLDAHCLVNP